MEFLLELNGHNEAVSCLQYQNDVIISGSYDHSIRTWEIIDIVNRIRENKKMNYEDLHSRAFEIENKGKDKKNKGKKNNKEENKIQNNEKKEKKKGKKK